METEGPGQANIIMLATGTGIAPMRSYLRWADLLKTVRLDS